MINALDPGSLSAIRRALAEAGEIVSSGTQMNLNTLLEVVQAFFKSSAVGFRRCWVRITPMGDYDSIYHEPDVDFARLLAWCAVWNSGTVAPEEIFFEFWRVHPLDDGNKRLGMVLTYAYCQKHHFRPPMFPECHVEGIKVTLFAIHYGDKPVSALAEWMYA
jgi:hypothetical protein